MTVIAGASMNPTDDLRFKRCLFSRMLNGCGSKIRASDRLPGNTSRAHSAAT